MWEIDCIPIQWRQIWCLLLRKRYAWSGDPLSIPVKWRKDLTLLSIWVPACRKWMHYILYRPESISAPSPAWSMWRNRFWCTDGNPFRFGWIYGGDHSLNSSALQVGAEWKERWWATMCILPHRSRVVRAARVWIRPGGESDISSLMMKAGRKTFHRQYFIPCNQISGTKCIFSDAVEGAGAISPTTRLVCRDYNIHDLSGVLAVLGVFRSLALYQSPRSNLLSGNRDDEGLQTDLIRLVEVELFMINQE